MLDIMLMPLNHLHQHKNVIAAQYSSDTRWFIQIKLMHSIISSLTNATGIQLTYIPQHCNSTYRVQVMGSVEYS